MTGPLVFFVIVYFVMGCFGFYMHGWNKGYDHRTQHGRDMGWHE